MFFIILGFFTLVGWLISSRLKSKFQTYSRIPLQNGMSGAEVAMTMLHHYGIRDVQITQGEGFLSDHYNPQKKVISLSPQVFQGRNVAAAAVAAHECGHAVQHATAYSMLIMRSNLVPLVQFSSKIQQFLFIAMILGIGINAGGVGSILVMVLVATFGITALFSLVTLPVEFDASKRALAWLDDTGITQGREYEGAKDALWWAAMTYVAQALSALVLFLYILLSFMGRD